MIRIRKAKSEILQAEDEMEELMRANGMKPEGQPRAPGRPLGSKNRPKTQVEAQDEARAG
jgi:hypothetical protein